MECSVELVAADQLEQTMSSRPHSQVHMERSGQREQGSQQIRSVQMISVVKYSVGIDWTRRGLSRGLSREQKKIALLVKVYAYI